MSLMAVHHNGIRTSPLYEGGQTYEYDYSHILPEELRQGGYSLEVTDDDCGHVQGNIKHDDGKRKTVVGNLSGFMKHDAFHSKYAKIDPLHRHRGLATAAHEAMVAHAKNELGATYISGELHGSFATLAHAQISQKYNMPHRPSQVAKAELDSLVGLNDKFNSTPLFKNDDPLMERVKHGSVEERSMALTDPGITVEHLAQASKDRSKTVLDRVVDHPLCTPEFIANRVSDSFVKAMIMKLLASTGRHYGEAGWDPHEICYETPPKIASPEALKRIWSVMKTMTKDDYPGRAGYDQSSNRTSCLRRMSRYHLTPREVLSDFPATDSGYDGNTKTALLNHPNADPDRKNNLYRQHVENMLTVQSLRPRYDEGELTDEERKTYENAHAAMRSEYRAFREAIDRNAVPVELVERLAETEADEAHDAELARTISNAQASSQLGEQTVNRIFDKKLSEARDGIGWDKWDTFIKNPKITQEHISRMLDVPTAAQYAMSPKTLANPVLADKVLRLVTDPNVSNDFLQTVVGNGGTFPEAFRTNLINACTQNYIPRVTPHVLKLERKIQEKISEAIGEVKYYEDEVRVDPNNEHFKEVLEEKRAELVAAQQVVTITPDQIRQIYAASVKHNERINALVQNPLSESDKAFVEKGEAEIHSILMQLPQTPPELLSSLIKDSLISGDSDDYGRFSELSPEDQEEVLSKARISALSQIIGHKPHLSDNGWKILMAKAPPQENDYGDNDQFWSRVSRHPELPQPIVESLAKTTQSHSIFQSLYKPNRRIITPAMLEIFKERGADAENDIVQYGGWGGALGELLEKGNYGEGSASAVPAFDQKFLEDLYNISPDQLGTTIAKSTFTPSSLLEKIIEGNEDSNTIAKALSNPKLDAGYMDRLISGPVKPEVATGLLANKKFSGDKIAKLLENNPQIRYLNEEGQEWKDTLGGRTAESKKKRDAQRLWNGVAMKVANHASTPDEWVDKQLASLPEDDYSEWAEALKSRVAESRPSLLFPKATIKVKLGSQKLRIMRDMILDSGKEEVPMSELPQGNWDKFRVITGDPKIDKQKLVSAKKIQETIDAIPEQTFHYHLRTWKYHELQRHRTDVPSDVFQLQLGDEHIKKIKERGLWSEWTRMRDADLNNHTIHPPFESGPAIAKSALGWMRLTGNAKKTGTLHADEVQCDYRVQGGGGGEEDEDGEQRDRGSEEVKRVVLRALFGDQDPHEVIMDAHAQYLRDAGLSHVVVHFPNLEFRGGLHPMEGFRATGAVEPGSLPPMEALRIKSEKVGRMAHAHAKERLELAQQIAQLEEASNLADNPRQKAVTLNKLQGAKKRFKDMASGFLKNIRALSRKAMLGILPSRGVRYRNTADKICQATVVSHRALAKMKDFDLDALKAEHHDLLKSLETEADPKIKKEGETKANAMHRQIVQHPVNLKQLESNHAENLSSLHDLMRIDPDLRDNITDIFERKLPAHYTDTYEKLPIKWASAPAKYGDEASETNTDKFGGFAMWKYKIRKFEDIQEDLHKSLKDIPGGKMLSNNGSVALLDYSHVLPPELSRDGYGIRLKVINVGRRIGSGGDGLSITADINKNGHFIGGANGDVSSKPNGERHLDIELSDVEDAHQGKGLGAAAYEAMMAFAHNGLKCTHVTGGEHSSIVSKLHSRLAQKHGMEYVPQPNFPSKGFADEEAWNAKKPGPYDAKYASYKYLLKADLSEIPRPSTMEEPEIQAADVVEGPFVEKSYDYSHLLPFNPNKNYKIIVQRRKKSFGPSFGLEAYLRYRGKDVGSVAGVVRPANSTMYLADAELDEDHRGRGMGKALYKALYAHAANDLKVKSVDGESHSDAARAVHESLAREYGFNYSAKRNIGPEGYIDSDTWRGNADRPFNGRWGSYEYDL